MSTENKLVREDVLAKESIKEISEILELDVVAYAEAIAGESVEKLKAREAELMDEFKANDEILAKAAYELPDSIDYDGVKLTRSELVNKIIGFLNRIEVEFRATLGIYQGIRFWKTAEKKPIPYGTFDSTLRLLGGLKFKGEKDCYDILVINNWFTSAHEGYSRDNIWTQYLHALHQTILKELDVAAKRENAEETASEATPDTEA
jgi:hypothetical protein